MHMPVGYRIIWCSLGATSLALDERLSTELWHQQMRPPSPFPCDPTPLVKFLSRHKCCRLPHPRPSRFFSAGQRVATLAIMNFGTLLRPPDLRAINLSTMQELVYGKEGMDVASALVIFLSTFQTKCKHGFESLECGCNIPSLLPIHKLLHCGKVYGP